MKKNALITGASRGIGKAAAECFAAAGYDLYLNCLRSAGELQQLSAYLSKKYNCNCRNHIGDMGSCSVVEDWFGQIPSVDVLINNAGVSYVGLLTDMTNAEWRSVMSTNLDSCFYTCKFAVPLMLSRRSGRIINISSVWGNAGASMEVAYSASKGAVNSFTKALAKELAPSNIQVNAIACGVIDTDMNRCFGTEELEQLRAEIPADRFGMPSEVASLALQLAEAPSYLTGQVITLDGGWL